MSAPGFVSSAENPYEAPRAAVQSTRHVFGAKRWPGVALLVMSGCFSAGLINIGVTGLSYAFAPRWPGLVLVLAGAAFGWLALQVLATMLALRGPVLRCGREGIEIRLLGRFEIDGAPLRPTHLAWHLLQGRVARVPAVYIPWKSLTSLSARGRWLARRLDLRYRPAGNAREFFVVVPGVHFAAPVRKVAEAVQSFAHDESRRGSLPGWGDEVRGRGEAPGGTP